MKVENTIDRIIKYLFTLGVLGYIAYAVISGLFSEIAPDPTQREIEKLSEQYQNLPTPSSTVFNEEVFNESLNEAQQILEISLNSWIARESQETSRAKYPNILFADTCRWDQSCPLNDLQRYELIGSRKSSAIEFCVALMYSTDGGYSKHNKIYSVRELKESPDSWTVIGTFPESEYALNFCPSDHF